jgi:hypothetical protein
MFGDVQKSKAGAKQEKQRLAKDDWFDNVYCGLGVVFEGKLDLHSTLDELFNDPMTYKWVQIRTRKTVP